MLQKFLTQCQSLTDQTLNQNLPPKNKFPSIIHEAMRYSIFAGGKRFRPALVMAAAIACNKSPRSVALAASAMEMIHTYSLIHDDLPAMDNDGLRRGKPTNHKVFGEDIAILAGDALLTHAFSLLALNANMNRLNYDKFSRLIEMTVWGSGTSGMIGGQVADIQSDKGRWKKIKNIQRLLNFIHLNKTAALIRTSLVVGALLSKASQKQINSLDLYGKYIGLAFQIVDDILDVTADKKKLGKKGSDFTNQKLTFVQIYGLKKSEKMARIHITHALNCLHIFGQKAQILRELAHFIINRDY